MPRPPARFKPVPYPFHHELILRIETLTNMGLGLARDGSWVVMVPYALPGEKVRVRIHRNHKNFSEADLLEVIEASPDRIEPACALFGTCGGCQYQHLRYEKQLHWKTRQVAELLEKMARIALQPEPAVASPKIYGYRSKLTPHFNRPKNGTIPAIGFLSVSSRSVVVDVPQCPLASEGVNAKLRELREELFARAHPFKNGATLLIRESAAGVTTAPADLAREELLGLRLEFPAGTFFQNNPSILPLLVQHVVDEAHSSGAEFLVDAYCGSGLFALAAAKKFRQVAGVEISEASVRGARANAQSNGLTNAEFLAADASTIFAQIPFPGEQSVVVMDPPRRGTDELFLRQLFAFGPRRVVYVSCNPATQMRDLQTMTQHGFKPVRAVPFDLFPQTKHLECVITLDRDPQCAVPPTPASP